MTLAHLHDDPERRASFVDGVSARIYLAYRNRDCSAEELRPAIREALRLAAEGLISDPPLALAATAAVTTPVVPAPIDRAVAASVPSTALKTVVAEGRVPNVTLAPRPDRSEAADLAFLETAVHEAGHACAAVVLGGQIERGYVLRPDRQTDDGLTGEVIVAAMPVGNAKAEIAFAGPWAQARFRAGGWPPPHMVAAVMATEGRRDRAMCARNGSGADGREVVGLMDRCWPAVMTVARRLVVDGEIRHEHVTAALGLSQDASQHAFELANIRAGLRAVPDPRGTNRR